MVECNNLGNFFHRIIFQSSLLTYLHVKDNHRILINVIFNKKDTALII